MTDAVRDAFAYQSKSCASLGSPFMEQLMRLCGDRDWPAGAVRDRIFGWPGELGPRGQSVPLRLAGGLHALRLQGNQVLDAVYPPARASNDALWDAVAEVLVTEEPFLTDWLDSAPQTNEVRRSGPLIALGHWLTNRFGLPIRTSELGASGGLNLHWDAYGLEVGGQTFGAADPALILRPDWTGPLPPRTAPRVVERAGVDLNPLDPAVDALRLQAFLWPDQPDRLRLTRAAIAATTTRIDKGDAVDWLASRLTHRPGTLHLIYTTVAWQYFPADKQDDGTAMIEAAGASATNDTPLAWFGMENDGEMKGAALTLRLWPGDLVLDMGRADFHGRWIDWRAE